MTRTAFDAIVVGAGPAGSTAAIRLARAGWAVVLVEKQRFPRRKVCGECIAASNLPLLDALGIGPDVEAGAGPALREVVLMHGDDAVTAALPAAASAVHRFGRAFDRETLDACLLAEARRCGVEVLQPWAVEAIDGTPGDWTCTVRAVGPGERSVLRAKVAIDAHGSWETLRASRPAGRTTRRRSDLFAFKADFRDAALPDEKLAVLAFDGGYGGMVVAGGGVTTVACCIRRDALERCRAASPGLDAGDAVQAFLAHACTGVRVALADATRDGPWLASGPLAPGVRPRGPDDPFRIGNACAEAHPIIGEGISMALQSAWLLCEQLVDARGGVPDADRQRAAARRFEALRRGHFGRRMRLASLFAHAAMRPAGAALLMAVTARWPGLLTAGARWGGKVRSAVDADADANGVHRARPSVSIAPQTEI